MRSYGGGAGTGYRHATEHPFGAIRFSGDEVEANFSPAGRGVRTDIDAAYRAKYTGYGDSYLQPMLAAQAVAATLRVSPRS